MTQSGNDLPQRHQTSISLGDEIRRLIERVAFEANRTCKSPGPDAVHDLRVSIRRLDQGLATFKVQIPRKPARKIRKQLRTILSAAGELRDCDIATEIVSKAAQPEAAVLQRRIRVRRKEAEKLLVLLLKRLSLRTRVLKWCGGLDLDTPLPLAPEALRTMARSDLPRLARRFFEAGQAVISETSGKRLHAFRILAKRFRYTLELFVPLYGAIGESWLSEIRSVQSVLGKMNDYRAVRSMLAELGSYKKIQAALKRSEHRLVRRFQEIWTERFTRTVGARWVRSLRALAEEHPVRKPIAISATAQHQTMVARA